ncbi:MAG: flavin reductase [Candidatus Cloacimonetes bacterium]|jgi:flavin reductase (DIM6/NTAB) family NADH-FMN oxidoreductase RutF|nr:flavin reductase [Candidatus Cloacimonadota bacterium]
MRELRIEGTTYPLLRHLTLPVVAITTAAGGRTNGMIVNSAQRASLVPSVPRISLYVLKPRFSYRLIMESGVFAVHLLRRDQWDVIWQLGMQSAHDVPDKLAGLDVHYGETGCPLLVDCIASFECRVVNAMDAGSATHFLGDVVKDHEGTPGEVMTSPWFRENMPADKKRVYEAQLAHAMEYLEPLAHSLDSSGWEQLRKRWSEAHGGR